MVKENMHLHSWFSWDSSLDLYDINKILMNGNITFGCITDHIEFDRESVEEVLAKFKVRNIRIDEINKMNQGKIILLKGAEISSPYKYPEQCKYLESLDLDFIMGSVHEINKDITYEPSVREEFYRYYERVLDTITKSDIDCLGHIDYINRYYENDYFFENQLQEIFQALKEKNQIIEINTSANRRGCASTFPDYEKLKMYKQYQSYVTIGSDAHKKNEVLDGLDETHAMANSLGLRPVIYQKRKRIKI